MTDSMSDDIFGEMLMDEWDLEVDDPLTLAPSATELSQPDKSTCRRGDNITDTGAGLPGFDNFKLFKFSHLPSSPLFSSQSADIDPFSLPIDDQSIVLGFEDYGPIEVTCQQFSAAQTTTNVGTDFTSVHWPNDNRVAPGESDPFDRLITGAEAEFRSTSNKHDKAPFISHFGNFDRFYFQAPQSSPRTHPTRDADADFQHLSLGLENSFIEVPVCLRDVAPAEINQEFGQLSPFSLYNGVTVVNTLNKDISSNINSDAPPTKKDLEPDFFDNLQLLDPFPEDNSQNHPMDVLVEKKPLQDSWHDQLHIPDLFARNDREMDNGQDPLDAQIPMNVDSLPLEVGISEVRSLPFPVHSSPATFVSHKQNSFNAQASMSFDIAGSTCLPFPRNSTGLFSDFDDSSRDVSHNSKDFWIPFNSLPVTGGPSNSITESDDNEFGMSTILVT